ncbi:hypothetical protein [Epilithonimonas hispanica]
MIAISSKSDNFGLSLREDVSKTSREPYPQEDEIQIPRVRML